MELIKRRPALIPAALLIAGIYAYIVQYALLQYIDWRSSAFVLGLIAIPVVLMYNPQHRRSLRFYYAALACCLLAWAMPVKTLLFAALVMAVCFLADNVFGKINALPLLAIGLIAPVFEYITSVFTFPIRLLLTRWAAGLLQALGLPAAAEGNTILWQGAAFSVDPACMGLGMMVSSMLCGLMVLGILQKKQQRELPFWLVGVLLGAVGALNVLSNLFRMLLLVILQIMPGDPLHDTTGLLCLVLYVLVPVVVWGPRLVRRFGRPVQAAPPKEPVHLHTIVLSHVCLAACIFLVAWKTTLPGAADPASATLPAMPGYACETLDKQIVKATSAKALVYLKPVGGFYRTDHNPTICWQGSGFNFKNIKVEAVAGRNVYTGILAKGHEQLYTAWWYDNGNAQTVSQWEWRWNTVRYGRQYTLVNVTAATREDLVQEAARWLNSGNDMKGG